MTAARKSTRWLVISLVTLVVVGLLGAGTLVWGQYGERISQRLGWQSNDYQGAGHGEVTVAITAGQIGSDVADTLAQKGVVKTAQAFYDLLLAEGGSVEFEVGSYKLRREMSAKAALQMLLDPASRVALTVTIPEGMTALDALRKTAKVVNIPYAEFAELAAQPALFGLPAEFPSVEGFLFPATYTFTDTDDAQTIMQKMVDRMWQALSEHNVQSADAWRVLTLAAMVQREAGTQLSDFPKIARVFLNRLDIGMHLQSDATVAYGTGNTHTVWTTPAERADATNRYNTYANPGLPLGPISLPGDVAIAAAVQPAAGPWLFFMPIDLESGKTEFSVTPAEHERNVEKLAAWCREHRAAGGTACD